MKDIAAPTGPNSLGPERLRSGVPGPSQPLVPHGPGPSSRSVPLLRSKLPAGTPGPFHVSALNARDSGDQDFSTWQDRESRTFCAEPSPAPGSSQGGRRVLWAGSGHPAGRGRVGCRSPLLPGPARPRADPAPAPSGPSFLGNEASWDGRGARTDSEFPVSMSRANMCACTHPGRHGPPATSDAAQRNCFSAGISEIGKTRRWELSNVTSSAGGCQHPPPPSRAAPPFSRSPLPPEGARPAGAEGCSASGHLA